ncbi:MAG: PAS domain-containing protein [Roseiflexaceae bacterium]|nr:PAS domain-containing protein [Roseiflexaceae bacterium]
MMVHCAPVLLWISDANNNCVFFNAPWLAFTGRTMEQEIGFGWAAGVHPDDYERCIGITGALFGKRAPFERDYRLRRYDGAYRLVRDTCVPRFTYGSPSHFEGYIGSCFDISDAQRTAESYEIMERRLLEAQKLDTLGVIVSGIAHDFNNLLTGLIGNAELLEMEVGGNTSAQHTAHTIEQIARSGTHMVRQLLDYAKSTPITMNSIDLSATVQETVGLLNTAVRALTTLDVRSHGALPILADPTQIQQVLMNLVINAADAIGEHDGRIIVETRRVVANRALREQFQLPLCDPAYALLAVIDNGMGMSDEVRENILRPFFTTKPHGRGLGLASVAQIVARHQGSMQIASARGNGTRFEILFPLHSAAPLTK